MYKEIYEPVEIEIITFEVMDIITSSDGDGYHEGVQPNA